MNPKEIVEKVAKDNGVPADKLWECVIGPTRKEIEAAPFAAAAVKYLDSITVPADTAAIFEKYVQDIVAKQE